MYHAMQTLKTSIEFLKFVRKLVIYAFDDSYIYGKIRNEFTLIKDMEFITPNNETSYSLSILSNTVLNFDLNWSNF